MTRRIVLLFLLLPALLMAQEERRLRGEVVSIGENGEEIPEIGLTVTIKQTGTRDRTNSDGIFNILIPDEFKADRIVELRLDKEGWRIHQPLDGEVRLPFDLKSYFEEVKLLPVGSPLFWTPDRIEKFIAELPDKSKQQINPEREEEVDFGPFLKEWAEKYGSTPEQAGEEIDKWIADIEKSENDITKLGLAAFAKKNFVRAGNLFEQAAATKEKRLEETQKRRERLEEKERRLKGDVIKNYRLAGDSHYSSYQFDKALTAYEKAIGFISKEESPQAWFDLTLEIAGTNRALGIRTAGTEIQKYFDAALNAYRGALSAVPKADRPEQWAAAQIGIGNVLAGQGIRTGGEPGGQLLGEAVDAYKNALEVRVYEYLPVDWAQTQNNLAETYGYLRDSANSAACFTNVLKVYPDYQEAYQTASLIYHETIFNYDQAFILNQNWHERHPDDQSARLDFAEKHFTTGRFPECETRIAEILENPEVAASSQVALQAVGLANATALAKLSETNDSLERLISTVSTQVESFKVSWQFNGTRHFIDISENEHLATHREWLLSLFQALEGENRQAILAALRQVQATWQQVAGMSR